VFPATDISTLDDRKASGKSQPDVTPQPVDGELSYRPEWDAPAEGHRFAGKHSRAWLLDVVDRTGPSEPMAADDPEFPLWATSRMVGRVDRSFCESPG
jgi:hypothetical protein